MISLDVLLQRDKKGARKRGPCEDVFLQGWL